MSYCAISVTWSDYPDVALRRWIKSVGDLMMVLVVLTDLDPVAAVKRVLTRTGFVLVPVSVLFIKYYPNLGRGYNHFTWTSFYTGVAMDKNALGMICLICGLGTVWRSFQAFGDKNDPHRRRHLIAHGTVLAMVLWLLGTANSVTSLSCFIMGCVLIAATRLFAAGRKPAVIHTLVFGIVSVSLFALFLDAGGGLIKSMGRNPTLTGRTEIWQDLIPLNTNSWLGTGFESFWLGDRLYRLWSKYWWHPNEAHNGYLEVYLNLGWVGVVLLFVLLVTGYRNVLAAFRRDQETGSARLAYFVAAVAYSFTEAGFRLLSPVWIFYLVATTAVPPAPSVSEATASVDIEPAKNLVEYGATVRAPSFGIGRNDL